MDTEESDESERRYQQLIRTSPAPINLFDESGEIIWGNDAVVDLLGLESREALIGRSIFEFVHSEDQYTAERELIEVIQDETAAGPTAMKLTRTDGSTVHIQVATAPGRYRGTDIGQAVIVDVTALKQAQAELESERRFVEDAINGLQDVFYVVDPRGALQRWNDHLLAETGYTESEVRTMDVEEFFVERDRDAVSASIATVFAEGSDVFEATVRTKHGKEIPYEFRKRRLVEDGSVVGLVGIGRDVSDRMAREQHLRAVDRLLQHQLRNQANVIRGRAEILDFPGDSARSNHVDAIDTAAERLLSIFDHHRDIVEQLTTTVDLESVDVVPVVEWAIREAEASHPNATVSADLPDTAMASAVSELDTAVLELLENAIVHQDEAAPTVDIALDVSESAVTIRVVDTGPEIPRMEYEPLLDTEVLGPTYHSSGLGLWLVHWIVQQSGGSLSFDTNDQNGNVVSIELRTPQTQWTASDPSHG